MYEAIVIGASAGGMDAIGKIISGLEKKTMPAIIIVQHISSESDNYLVKYLGERTWLKVMEANNQEKLEKGTIYIAPPNYHILIEKDKSITLSVEKKVLFSRPSIDLLFLTAAEAYREKLIGIILTGASSDGSLGLKRLKELGGFGIAQEPSSALVDIMPASAIKVANPDKILKLDEIAHFLNEVEFEI